MNPSQGKDEAKFLAMTAQKRKEELSRLKLLYFDLIEAKKAGTQVRNLELTKQITLRHINFLKPIVKEENRIAQREFLLRKKDLAELFFDCAKEQMPLDEFNAILNAAQEIQRHEDEMIIKANK
jgi:hypothetical protein